MRTRPLLPTVALLAVVLSVMAACSADDGRRLPSPNAHQTTTSVSAPVVGQPSSDASAKQGFSLSSPTFTNGGRIPARHTCAGDDISPTLIWAFTPPGAELALVVRDRDAGGFVHWVVSGIDPAVEGIGEGGIPEGAVAGNNSSGTAGWSGPCPPAGSGTHTYDLVLHVLPQAITIDPTLPAEQAAQLIESASSARATLSGTVTASG